MARHVWSLLCSRSVVDGQTNLLSIFDVVEEVQAAVVTPAGTPAPESVPINFNLVSLWERSIPEVPEENETCQVRIISPTGKELGRTEQVFSMIGPHSRSRVTIAIRGLPAKENGRYEVQVFERSGARWKKVAAIPLIVTVTHSEQAGPQMPS